MYSNVNLHVTVTALFQFDFVNKFFLWTDSASVLLLLRLSKGARDRTSKRSQKPALSALAFCSSRSQLYGIDGRTVLVTRLCATAGLPVFRSELERSK